jgi:hypothetical protein
VFICGKKFLTLNYQRSNNDRFKETLMIKVGDKLPGGKLWELAGEWENTCSLSANDIDIEQATAGKRIVMFGVPAAFTKT